MFDWVNRCALCVQVLLIMHVPYPTWVVKGPRGFASHSTCASGGNAVVPRRSKLYEAIQAGRRALAKGY